MRARLMMKLMGLAFMVALTAIAAHSFSSSSSSKSVIDPSNLANTGLQYICQTQQADAAAAGDSTAPSSPLAGLSASQIAQINAQVPGGMKALQNALGGNIQCPTTTTLASGGN